MEPNSLPLAVYDALLMPPAVNPTICQVVSMLFRYLPLDMNHGSAYDTCNNNIDLSIFCNRHKEIGIKRVLHSCMINVH